jgi:hypothetical protein
VTAVRSAIIVDESMEGVCEGRTPGSESARGIGTSELHHFLLEMMTGTVLVVITAKLERTTMPEAAEKKEEVVAPVVADGKRDRRHSHQACIHTDVSALIVALVWVSEG